MDGAINKQAAVRGKFHGIPSNKVVNAAQQ
jgi:hypothetical protein